jgi:hypothetical protein
MAGPLQVIAVGFGSGADFEGRVLAEVGRLQGRGVLRLTQGPTLEIPGLPRPLARACCWSAGCPRLDPWYRSSIAANASACDLARDDAHVYIARTARPGPDADVLL